MSKLTEEYIPKLKSFIKECYRVVQVTRKPNKQEYKSIVKITGLGILLIGVVGFIIAIIGTLAGI